MGEEQNLLNKKELNILFIYNNLSEIITQISDSIKKLIDIKHSLMDKKKAGD